MFVLIELITRIVKRFDKTIQDAGKARVRDGGERDGWVLVRVAATNASDGADKSARRRSRRQRDA